MSGTVEPEGVPPGVIGTPQGDVVALGANETKDYARLVFSAPRFEMIAIAEIIQPSVTEAVQAVLPSLVPPYVVQAANDAVNALAVRRVGDSMSGALNLSPTIPTAPSMAASKSYVDTMVATSVPEVPPVPAGGTWARQTGIWVPLAGGGSVTNIATTGGITGGPITTSGTIQLANMAGNTLKGNNTGSTAAPTDLTVAQTMTMLGAAPLNSPAFSGTPQLPTGTAAVTQPGGTNNTSVATTAFVVSSVAAQLVSPIFTGNPTAPTPAPGDNDTSIATTAFVATSFAPLASPVFTGAPTLPTGTVAVTQAPGVNNTTVATTAYATAAIAASVANYLPLTGGTLAGPGNLTVRGGILGGAAGTVPAAGSALFNGNTVAPPAYSSPPSLAVAGADNVSPVTILDAFGTSATPQYMIRRARGTAAAPTAMQNGDFLGGISAIGRAASAYSATSPSLLFTVTENWTATNNGSGAVIYTTVNGGTTSVASMTLQGNSATFSGTIVSVGSVTVNAAGGYGVLYLNGTHAWQVFADNTNNFAISDNTAGANRLLITGAGACSASSTWSVISDAGLKTDIEDHPHGLAEILQLQPRRFRMVDDDRIATGLIAQEVETIMPELVGEMTVGDDGATVKTVCEAGVIWPMLNAIKELNARLTAVEGRTA